MAAVVPCCRNWPSPDSLPRPIPFPPFQRPRHQFSLLCSSSLHLPISLSLHLCSPPPPSLESRMEEDMERGRSRNYVQKLNWARNYLAGDDLSGGSYCYPTNVNKPMKIGSPDWPMIDLSGFWRGG